MLFLPEFAVNAAVFLFAGAVTPGPNNAMLAASGVNFGFRRTVPHICGIVGGAFTVMFAAGLGAGSLFSVWPMLHNILRFVAAAWIFWIAWRIASAAPVKPDGVSHRRPMSFAAAAAFQWVNPKAWVIVLGAISVFTTVGGRTLAESMALAVLFVLVSVPSASLWAGFGAAAGRWFRAHPAALRGFNIAMGLLLVLTVIPVLRVDPALLR